MIVECGCDISSSQHDSVEAPYLGYTRWALDELLRSQSNSNKIPVDQGHCTRPPIQSERRHLC